MQHKLYTKERFGLPERNKDDQTNASYKDKSPSSLEREVQKSFYNKKNSIQENVVATAMFAAEDITIHTNNRKETEKQEFKKQQEHPGLYIIKRSPTTIIDVNRTNYDIILQDSTGKQIPLVQEEDTDVLLTGKTGFYEGSTYVKDEHGHVIDGEPQRNLPLQNPGLLIPRQYIRERKQAQAELLHEQKKSKRRSTYIGAGVGVTTLGTSLIALDTGILPAGVLTLGTSYLTKVLSNQQKRYTTTNTTPTLFGEKQEGN